MGKPATGWNDPQGSVVFAAGAALLCRCHIAAPAPAAPRTSAVGALIRHLRPAARYEPASVRKTRRYAAPMTRHGPPPGVILVSTRGLASALPRSVRASSSRR
jgi:hypothetical protein